MDVDLASLHKILKDPTRRRIVLHLDKGGTLAYVELMNLLEITNTGKINYHLKILNNLIEKGKDGKYRLTERGQLAAQLLQKFPEKMTEAKPLGIGDAFLIGIVGSQLLIANPGVYGGIGIYLSIETFSAVALLLFIYWLFVPAAVMWWLTVRHTKRHNLHDLLKPPIVPMVPAIALIGVLWLVRVSLSPRSFNNGLGQPLGMGFVALVLLTAGCLPFMGVVITELLFRLLRRR